MSKRKDQEVDSSKGKEHVQIANCRKRLNNSQSIASGVVMDLFEFTDDTVNTFKVGHVFHTTSQERISFDKGEGARKGCIKLLGPSKAISARFQIRGVDEQDKVEDMVLRSFSLKHEAILKPLLCARSDQLLKVVSGLAAFNQMLADWIQTQKGRNVSREPYLSDGEKKMVSSGLEALEEICVKGYACDGLDQPSNYVIVSGNNYGKIKIVPSAIRDWLPGETHELVLTNLRKGFASLLENHLAPLWNNQEVAELISLIRNPHARLEDLLGHQVLSCPGKRLVLYRRLGRGLTYEQVLVLNQRLQFNNNWKTKAMADTTLAKIISKNNFTADAFGVVTFGRIVSCHYSEELKYINKGAWRNLRVETPDKLLQGCIPLVLCRLYALGCDPAFLNA